jgi:hypothetical protein
LKSSIFDFSSGDYPGCNQSPVPAAARMFSDFFKVIVQAMACDITRFCTIQLGDGPDAYPNFTNTGIINQMPGLSNYTDSQSPNDFHGSITHTTTCDVNDPSTITLALYKRYFMSQVANLLGTLKAIPDPYNPSQSLYDNTIVLIGSEGAVQRRILNADGSYYVSDGHGSDQWGDKGFVIAGGCGGYFKKGQMIFAGSPNPAPGGGGIAPIVTAPHNAILTNIINAFEKNQQQVNPAYIPKYLTQYGDYSFSVSPTSWLT